MQICHKLLQTIEEDTLSKQNHDKRKKLQTNISYKYELKTTPQQNTSKQNPSIYKKYYTQWTQKIPVREMPSGAVWSQEQQSHWGVIPAQESRGHETPTLESFGGVIQSLWVPSVQDQVTEDCSEAIGFTVVYPLRFQTHLQFLSSFLVLPLGVRISVLLPSHRYTLEAHLFGFTGSQLAKNFASE